MNARFPELFWYIWYILYSPWDDQWPESEVWEMIVNSPARAINNNLGSDFTSNSNRLHQSLAHCLCLGDESITTEKDRVGLGSLWSGSLQRTQTQDLSQMELCVYSRERSSGGKMTQRRAYFVTRSDAAHEWWIHSFCSQLIACTACHNSHTDPGSPLVFEIKRIIG